MGTLIYLIFDELSDAICGGDIVEAFTTQEAAIAWIENQQWDHYSIIPIIVDRR